MTSPFRAYEGVVPPIDVLLAALKQEGTKAQLFDATRVAGHDHLAAALAMAERAAQRGESGARDPGLEFLRYLAGERQIGKALAAMGLRPGRAVVGALVLDGGAGLDRVAGRFGWRRDDALLDPAARGGADGVLDAWGVDPAERASVPRPLDLVLERVALTDAWK